MRLENKPVGLSTAVELKLIIVMQLVYYSKAVGLT
jgi:hypothetical protein